MGARTQVLITEEPLDERALEAQVSQPENGAVLLFRGIVRDHHEGRAVAGIHYEAYRAMAEKELRRVTEEVAARHDVRDLAVAHRLGTCHVGDLSLLVAAGAHHRRPVFEAVLELVDELKRQVPIWKREFGPDGERWQEGVLPEAPRGEEEP